MQAPSLSESPLSPLEMRPSVESLRSADSASPTATSVEPSQSSKQALQKTSLTSIPEVGSPPYLSVEGDTDQHWGHQWIPLLRKLSYAMAMPMETLLYRPVRNCANA